jgi:hypothetical protein
MVGPGRSGTTISARLLGSHPGLAWFSGPSNRVPHLAAAAAFGRLARIHPDPGIRGWPKPSEAISVWDAHFPGFYDAACDLTEVDADQEAAQAFRRLVDGYRRWQGGQVFFTKITGWPRISFVRSVLPGVRLVQVERDPRPVVLSMLRGGWGGVRNHPERYAEVDPLEHAAAVYLRFFEARRNHDWSGVRELRYERLVEDPHCEMAALAEELGLTVTPAFLRRLARFDVRPERDWRSAIDGAERSRLTALLERPIRELGYEP